MIKDTPPLDGLLVIALEHAIAAPLCTRQLAELGARVIKIERREQGDFARHYDDRVKGLCSHFVWTNRSKESLTLDLKHPAAAGILARLLTRADVLVQNLAPSAAARMGLGYEALATDYPQLIVCNITGYGEEGPYASKKAYDLLVQAEAGFLSVTGSRRILSKAAFPLRTSRRVRRRIRQFWPPCCSVSAPVPAAVSTSRCWKPWWSGWAFRFTTLTTGSRRLLEVVRIMPAFIPTGCSGQGMTSC